MRDGAAQHAAPEPVKRRGRRPGGTDTRDALLLAAREVFTEQGYDGATVRAIAARAGVDAAMVNHWFGSKDRLFAEAVLKLPFNPQDLVSGLRDGPIDTLGERIVRTFLTNWDNTGGGMFTALVRSLTAHEQAAQMLREYLIRHVITKLLADSGVDRIPLRATLIGSQLVGMGMVRYVARFEPLASTEIEQLVLAVGPNLQRYINGTIT